MAYRNEKTLDGNDIVIDGWNEGITDNPYQGIYDIRNCDVTTIPGEVSVAMSTTLMNSQAPMTNVLFSANTGPDTIQYNGTIPVVSGTAILFTNSGGSLPAPLVAGKVYYVITVVSGMTFTISGSMGGTIINLTTGGSGTNSFSTINMGTINYFSDSLIINYNRIYFALDNNGRAWCTYSANQIYLPQTWIYMNNLGTETTTNNGNGLIAYKGYLFVFLAGLINVINFNGNGNWQNYPNITNNSNWVVPWKISTSLTFSTISHYAMLSINDDSVYFCNGGYVGLIAYNTSALTNPNQTPFNISTGRVVTDGVVNGTTTLTSSTMMFTNADIGAYITGTFIPANTYIVSVTNSYTVILSNSATNSQTGVTLTIYSTYTYDATVLPLPSNDLANCLGELGSNLMIGGSNNYIYPWDRVSTNYSTPIFLSEYRISRLVTINTTMYIFCGFKGRIFVTNGANATPFYKIPDYLSGTTNPYYFWTDASFSRNQLYFGFTVTDNSGNTINNMGGLWSVDVDSVTPVAPRLQNIMSYGTYAGYINAIHVWKKVNIIQMPASDGYGMLCGWYDGVSTSGIDLGVSTPYLAGQSYIYTDPIPVGQYLTKATFNNVQYKMGIPLASGESVAISYRTNLSDAFTPVPITDIDSSGLSGWGVVNFQESQWVQLGVTLTAINGGSNCRLREIRLH